MSEMHQSTFKLPSIRIRDVRVLYLMTAQISHQVQGPFADIACKKLTCGFLGAFRHVYGHQCCTQNWDMFEKTTLWHFCNRLWRSVHQSRRFSAALLKEVEVDRPCYFKDRHTVRLETGRAANLHISWLMFRDVVIRFCGANFAICLSSQVLTMEGRWDLSWLSAWPSETH